MVLDSPAWTESFRANHFGVFRDSGLNVKQYRYYNSKDISLDLGGMLEDINVSLPLSCLNLRLRLLDL